jgi:hypothetical protein
MNNAENSIRNSGLLTIGAGGAAAAAAVNAALFGIGKVADLSYVVVDRGTERTVEFGAVLSTSLGMVVIGLLGLGVAYRFFGRRSLRAFGILGMVIAVLSSVSFPAAEADTGTKWLLFAMHMVVGVAYLASLEIVRSRTAGAASLRPGATDESSAATLATA